MVKKLEVRIPKKLYRNKLTAETEKTVDVEGIRTRNVGSRPGLQPGTYGSKVSSLISWKGARFKVFREAVSLVVEGSVIGCGYRGVYPSPCFITVDGYVTPCCIRMDPPYLTSVTYSKNRSKRYGTERNTESSDHP